MPRGVPSNGFRKTKKRLANPNFAASLITPIREEETDSQILAKLKERFEVLTSLTNASISGVSRSLIVSGPAGLGKSFTVEEALNEDDPDGNRHTIIKGYVRATGLFRSLYEHRHPHSILVFDDADSVFFDDTCLNLLKSACDSTDRRRISWMSETRFETEEGGVIPRTFEFEGTVIFISNLDFDSMIDKGHKLAPHLQALISRSHYIDLAMKTKRDYHIRIKQVVAEGMLSDKGYSPEIEQDVLHFINDNLDSLRELSLRMALKLAALRKTNEGSFHKFAKITCCKNG